MTAAKRGFRNAAKSFLILSVAGTLPNATLAQSADDGDFFLGTLTLEARRLDESFEDVPFNTTVLTQEQIEKERVVDNDDLAARAANVFLIESGTRGFNRFNIRGVGDPGGGFAPDDNSVAFFIEGIPVPLIGIDTDLFDVGQVEILRGPQNGLFGRNAQGGAINIQLRDPSDTLQRSVGFEFGERNQFKISGTASGPITDRISGRIALQYSTVDGDVPNDIGRDLRDLESVNLVASIDAQLTENTELTSFLRYEHEEEGVLLRALLEDPAFPRVRLDIPPQQEVENLTWGTRITHDFGAVTFESLTGLYFNDYSFQNDLGEGRLFAALTGLPAFFFDDPTSDFAFQESDETRINQEFRLTGDLGRGTWFAGTNLFYSDYDFLTTLASTGFFNGNFDYEIETQSYDVFGGFDAPLGGRWSVQGDLRYTYEDEDLTVNYTSNDPTALVQNNFQTNSVTSEFVTGRLAVLYTINDQTNAYASYARGAKAGGFATFDTDLGTTPGAVNDQFDTARTDSYEIGIRGSSPDNRVRYSVAAFFNDTQDEQLSAFDFTTFLATVRNADTETSGVEFEITAEPIAGLTVTGAFGYLDTEITAADPLTGALVGGEVPYAPDVTVGLGVAYAWNARLFGLSGIASAGAFYQHVGSRMADIGNTTRLAPYDVVDLRVRFEGNNGLEVFAFVDNVFDEEFVAFAFPFGTSATGSPINVATPSKPRTIGAGLKYTF